MGQAEVTFAQWDVCVADVGCAHNSDDEGWGRGRRPVFNVSWEDAQQYVTWLSNSTGHDYRLLSESEWEYATRAGTTECFNTGDCSHAVLRSAFWKTRGQYLRSAYRQGFARGTRVNVNGFRVARSAMP